MLIVAEQKNTRQTPRKVRLVANSVRKLPLEKALRQLAVVERKATIVVLKVIRQTIANAVHNHRINPEDLVLKNILVTEGARYKRFRAVSRGRAHNVVKKTCNVKVILETQAGVSKLAKVDKPKVKKPTKVVNKKEAAKEAKKVASKAAAAPVLKKMAPQKVAAQKSTASTASIRRGTK